MNLHVLKEEFFDYLHEMYIGCLHNKYIKYGAVLVSIVLVSFLLLVGYNFFEKRKSQYAYASLMECLVTFDEALEAESPDWNNVLALCTQQREIHKSSSLAPYFDLISSNILLKKDAHPEALEAIKNATHAIGNTEIAPLIKLKHALMLLDSNDPLMVEEGLKRLTALTQDNRSRIHDMALYQLGRYFFAINENEKAKDTWKLLIEQSDMHTASPSPWAMLAQQKINQLL